MRNSGIVRLKKSFSIVAVLLLLFNSIVPTVPVFADDGSWEVEPAMQEITDEINSDEALVEEIVDTDPESPVVQDPVEILVENEDISTESEEDNTVEMNESQDDETALDDIINSEQEESNDEDEKWIDENEEILNPDNTEIDENVEGTENENNIEGTW